MKSSLKNRQSSSKSNVETSEKGHEVHREHEKTST